jgi:hypothetical protein
MVGMDQNRGQWRNFDISGVEPSGVWISEDGWSSPEPVNNLQEGCT